MASKNWLTRLIFWVRDLRSKKMFQAMRTHARGHILDVGGWDFFLTAKQNGVPYETWTCLEVDETRLLEIDDSAYRLVHGDGCRMDFEDESFDTILNIQVLEHVFEPRKMVRECRRVLKEGGYGIFLVPQTSTMHDEPHYYYNFSPFWIKQVMREEGLEIVSLEPLGGIWSTEASHLVYFLLQTFTRKLKSPIGERRSPLFYLLYPFMVSYALFNIPITMLFSLGDLSEEANNHLVVVRKQKP